MPRTSALCSRHPRWGSPDPPACPSSRRRARRSAGRTGTRRRAGNTWSTSVMASLSNSGLAQPPRSNPPLRFSSGPPFPCTTPSTETCVMVVSFMIAVPFARGRPRWRPLTSATNISPPSRHRRPDLCPGLSGTPAVLDSTAQRCRARRCVGNGLRRRESNREDSDRPFNADPVGAEIGVQLEDSRALVSPDRHPASTRPSRCAAHASRHPS